MKKEFIHHIPKEKEGTYYTVPFSVPSGIEKLTVSYKYHRGTKGMLADLHPTNTVDFGLMDETGKFLGWSGSAHESVFISEFSSTKGYLSEKINAGQWKIIVGAYHVVEGGVDVRYSLEFEEEGEKLLFGDLHIHSTASDGKYDIPTLGKMARDAGLDFVGIANHNNYCENLSFPHVDNLTFIPAVEWTHYKGHINFFGVEAPFENSFIANTKEEMQSLIAHAKSLGAVISVNHPKCPFCPYLWEDNDIFDMMEIWNGPMSPRNMKALDWWTELLRQGRKIPIVGGSDFHKDGALVKFASPVTGVISKSRGKDDILTAIRNGHSFVTSDISGARLFLDYNGAKNGDTVKFDENIKLHVEAENLGGARLVLVTDYGEKELDKNSERVHINIKLSEAKFAYVKAVKGKGKFEMLRAVSNPIYFE